MKPHRSTRASRKRGKITAQRKLQSRAASSVADGIEEDRAASLAATQRAKTAEEVLRRYTDLYELSSSAYVSLERSGRIAEINLTATELLGLTRGRAIGMPFALFVAREDSTLFLHHLLGCRCSNTRVETELRLKTGRNREIYVRLSSSPAVTSARNGGLVYHTTIVDLSERKRAEEVRAEAARQQKALYDVFLGYHEAKGFDDVYKAALDGLLNALPCHRAAVLLCDKQNTMRFVSSRGLSHRYRKAVEGHSPWKPGTKDPQPVCVPDVDLADLPKSLKSVIRAEGIRAVAFIPLATSGTLIGKLMIYYETLHAFSDEELKLAATIARQLAQIIEHRRAQEALARKEAELESIVKKTPFMLTRCTRDLRYRYVSPSYAEMIGSTPEELAGRPIIEILGKEGLATIRPYVDRVLKGETVTYEMLVPFKGAEPHFLSTAYVPDKNERGEVVGWFASLADISERKKAEERFRLAVEASPSGMIMTDQKGEITLINSQAEELFGYTRDELLGKPIDTLIPEYFRHGHGNHRGQFVAARQTRAVGSQRDLFGLRKDGTEVPIEIGRNPIRVGKENVILSSVVDITERKRAEQHLRIRDAVSRALAECTSMKEAAPRIIQAICDVAGWETGALWDINECSGDLFCVAFWQRASVKVPAFEAATRRMTYQLGTGLPGRVWLSGKAIWAPDVAHDEKFLRARFAMEDGLHAAVSFPIKLGDQVLGTVECFTREIRQVDQEMLEMLSLIGSQMGQFVKHKKAEAALAEANRQKSALYDFSRHCQNVKSYEEIYASALDAIVTALQCDHASILLYDEQQVMRFIAWRGLSTRYRKAVEGHSPWKPNAKNPQPVAISDIALAELPKALKQTILREGIRSAAFIPLVSDGKLIGKFMAYHRVPHVFDDGELKLAATIAQHLGQAIEHRRDEDALRERERQLARELEDQKQLQRISSQLIEQHNIEATYSQIVDTTVALVRSDMGRLQMFIPETGELVLLAHKGFPPSSAKAWQPNDHTTTCAEACRRGKRVIVPDVEQCHLGMNKKDLDGYRRSGIRAVQSTPLISRDGEFIGMISTHWREVHQPSARELRLLDVMARQAADLIEWKRSEDEVRESEARMRATVEQATAGVGGCDMRGRIVFANRTLCQMLGYNESELIGKTIADVTHPEDAKENGALFARLIRKGKPFDIEKRYVRKNGSILWGHVSVSPVRDATGEIKSAVAVAVDVTARKEAEAELQKSKEVLEQRVRERTRELHMTNKKLKSEIERRKGLEGEILSVSDREQQRLGQELHDGLCQHLTAVAFMTRSIALRLRDHRVIDATDIEKVAELVNEAAINTRNLSRALHRVDVDAAGLIVALQDLADREIWRTPCRLVARPSFRIDDDAAAVHLYRIAREAVINANKHAQAREIVVRLERVRKEMVLRVIDDGIGLPKELKPQQGLGFHIMNYRTQLMGGRLEIDSSQAGGTRVSCYLPVRAAGSRTAPNGDQTERAKRKYSNPPVAGDLTLRHLAQQGAANG